MQASGNDFIVIDATQQPISLSTSQIHHLASRHYGVGCDQLLMIGSPILIQHNQMSYPIKIYNSDGSEVQQCGNGLRAIASFLATTVQQEQHAFLLQVADQIYPTSRQENNHFAVNLGQPIWLPNKIPANFSQRQMHYQLPYQQKNYQAGLVSFANPHCVIVVDSLTEFPLVEFGEALNNNPCFPEGINLECIQLLDKHTIAMRVYERGVGETQACGSGACAAVACGHLWQYLANRVTVRLNQSELIVELKEDGYWLSGAVEKVFIGTIHL